MRLLANILAAIALFIIFGTAALALLVRSTSTKIVIDTKAQAALMAAAAELGADPYQLKIERLEWASRRGQWVYRATAPGPRYFETTVGKYRNGAMTFYQASPVVEQFWDPDWVPSGQPAS